MYININCSPLRPTHIINCISSFRIKIKGNYYISSGRVHNDGKYFQKAVVRFEARRQLSIYVKC